MFNPNDCHIEFVDDETIPNSYVQHCTECCFEDRPGKPNIRGKLQKQLYPHCCMCPVTKYGTKRPAKTHDGKYIYWKGTNQKITEGDLIILETDGNDLSKLVEVRD